MNATMDVLALGEMSEVKMSNESNVMEPIELNIQSNGSIVAEMAKLVQERQRFENEEFERTNQSLYAILSKAYAQYLRAKEDKKVFKETVKQLVTILKSEEVKIQTNTLAINLFVRFVFRSDRQRAHNYSRTLQAAASMNVKPEDLAKFITDAGGVEQCKKQVVKSDLVVKKKQTIAQAMPRVAELIKETALSPVATFKVDRDLVAASFDQEMTFLIGKTDKNGNVSVVSVIPGFSQGFANWAKQQLAAYLAEHLSEAEMLAKQQERRTFIETIVQSGKKTKVASETVGELLSA